MGRSAWVRLPRKIASGNRVRRSAAAGPSPMTTLLPGSGRERNASRFFSGASRPTERNIGRGRPAYGSTDATGLKPERSTPRPPRHHLIEAPSLQFSPDRRRGDHHAVAGIVEAAERPVCQPDGHRQARPQILREARVEARREDEPFPQGDPAHRPADGPFRRDMDVIRPPVGEDAADHALVRPGHLDLGIAGHRRAPEKMRRDHVDAMAPPAQLARRCLQRLDHAIDLRSQASVASRILIGFRITRPAACRPAQQPGTAQPWTAADPIG